MKKFMSETVLKCTVTIDFAVLTIGTEKPTAKDTPLCTEYARKVFQNIQLQLAIAGEHFF